MPINMILVSQPKYSEIRINTGTDRDGGDLRCSGVDWGIHGWASVTLGGAATTLRAEMDIDSKEAQSFLCFPMGDKWFPGGVPSGVERIDAAGVEASSILWRQRISR